MNNFSPGILVGPEPANEADHFIQCPDCKGWLDMRDLGEILDHDKTECTPKVHQ
jgi:Zn-finger nucleic acid-binding protein